MNQAGIREESRRSTRISARSIALPVEHGGWGFTLEPIALGMATSPTLAGVGIAVAALGAFMAHRPVRLVLVDRLRRRWLPRTKIAFRFAVLYSLIGGAGLAVAAGTAVAPFWPVLTVALVPASFSLWADAHSHNRTFAAELAGAVAMAAVAPAIALAAGGSVVVAIGLWLVLACRDVASIALVRSQLERLRGKRPPAAGVYAIQTSVLLVGVVAAIAGVIPWLAAVALAGLVVLAVVTLRGPDRPVRVIGWTQMAVGLGVVAITALGVNLGS